MSWRSHDFRIYGCFLGCRTEKGDRITLLFICIEACHSLSLVLLSNSCFNLLWIRFSIYPGVHQICCAELGISFQNLGIGGTLTTLFHHQPDWNSSFSNACIPTHDPWCFLDFPACALTGAGVASTVGNMGLVGAFGGVSVGAAPVVAAGAITGSAVYGFAFTISPTMLPA